MLCISIYSKTIEIFEFFLYMPLCTDNVYINYFEFSNILIQIRANNKSSMNETLLPIHMLIYFCCILFVLYNV